MVAKDRKDAPDMPSDDLIVAILSKLDAKMDALADKVTERHMAFVKHVADEEAHWHRIDSIGHRLATLEAFKNRSSAVAVSIAAAAGGGSGGVVHFLKTLFGGHQ